MGCGDPTVHDDPMSCADCIGCADPMGCGASQIRTNTGPAADTLFGRLQPISVEICPNLGDFRPAVADIGRNWPKFGRSQHRFGPPSVESSQAASYNIFWPNVDQILSNSGTRRSIWAIPRLESAHFQPIWGRIRPDVGDTDRFRHTSGKRNALHPKKLHKLGSEPGTLIGRCSATT